MGAYPQGNNIIRKLYLIKKGIIDTCKICTYHKGCNRHDKFIRTDKYKSKYRIQRKFKLNQIKKNKELEDWRYDIV
jgi:hypothetical protein